jgi:LmbE family N-acetylglucosaminyl deacetylase
MSYPFYTQYDPSNRLIDLEEDQHGPFYHSWVPNTFIDITHSRERKHRALDAYKAQFALEDFPMVHMWVELKERMHAENCTTPGCTHAEALKVLNPRLLHGVGEAWKY